MQILALAVAAAVVAGASGPQAQPPVFRGDVYVVPIRINAYIVPGSPFGTRKPLVDLTIDDFIIVLDKKTYVPVDVKQDPPGQYLVSFSPPEELRDGKKHNVEVRIAKKFGFKRKEVFPKPATSAPGRSGNE